MGISSSLPNIGCERKTTGMEIIQICQTYSCFELPNVVLKNRTEKFRKKYTKYHLYTRYDI